jgi:hypothetical protein
VSNAKTDPHRLPSVSGAEANQELKRQFIPIPGWPIAVMVVLVIAVLLAVYA